MLLLIALNLVACDVSTSSMTSPFQEYPVTKIEAWNIGGEDYKINGTAVILFPRDVPMFAVKVLVDRPIGAEHENIAKSIAKYALNNGYFQKATELNIMKDKIKIEISKDIGVSILYRKEGAVVSKGTGHNYRFKQEEL